MKDIVAQHTAVAVILNDGRRVSLDRIEHEPHDYVRRIVWANGTESWGRSWARFDGQVWRHTRIGAGTDGRLGVWRLDREAELALIKKERAYHLDHAAARSGTDD